MKKAISLLTTTISTLTLSSPVFAGDTTPPADFSIPMSRTGLQVGSLPNVITAGVRIMVIFASVLLFIFLVWGGIQWLTSGGDKNNVEAARNRITAALIGLAIVALAWAIQAILSYFFGLQGLESLGSLPTAVTGVTE
jgi:hypothetical protein